MIVFKSANIVTSSTKEDLISRLSWKLHPSKGPVFRTNAIAHDTSKPLVGNLENEVFTIARIRPVYKSYLPVVTISGRFYQTGGNTMLTLRYRPSILTTVILIFFFYAAVELIWNQLNIGFDTESFLDLIIWILLFPVAAIVLLLREGDKTKDILLGILGIKE